MKYKNFIIPDDFVEETVNKLGCSMVEAGAMYLSDNGLVKDEVIEQEIIDAIFTGLLDFHPEKDAFTVRNKEKYIDFTIAGRNFTVNLVEHRPKKK